MSIKSGKENETDGDIVLNSKGEPYIPGTSLAGIYRSLFCEEEQLDEFFGYITKNEEDRKTKRSKNAPDNLQSPIVVYDGKCCNYKENISVRDSVSLDEYKVAETGAKFDFQVAETGLEFISYIELDKHHTEDMEKAVEDKIIPALNSGIISLGHKKTRGYGRVSVAYQKREFDIETELDEWLDFDMFDDGSWDGISEEELSEYEYNGEIITIPLVQKGAISIRRYVTDAPESEEKTFPDYEQITLKNGTPVIPGTSWAGAFRHRIANYLENYCTNNEKLPKDFKCLFGFVEGDKSKKSDIYFSETELSGGTQKIITRNSIDRFSAGTKDGALFTERTYYNCKTELKIEIRLKEENSTLKKLVYACVLDLCLGYLAVGGLTSIGHGIFEFENDKKINMNGENFNICEWRDMLNGKLDN